MPVSADEGDKSNGAVVRFPQSRVGKSAAPFRELGQSLLARRIGAPAEQATGHWCSRCRVWYGYLLEVTCPVCGNRHGEQPHSGRRLRSN